MKLLLAGWLLSVLLPIGSAAQTLTNPFPDTLNRQKLNRIIIAESAFYAAGISYLHFIWYRDKERVPFHFYNDNAGYLQMDKMGHVYGAYVESYIGYHSLRRAGVQRNKALIYGGALGLVLQTPIEIFDGLYEGWGFSWGDMIANTAGSALVVGNELLFGEQLIKYKFSFWRSTYARQANGYLGDNFLESIFLDYNSHTYWLSLPANQIFLKEHLPPWLSLAVGYSANGMFGEFENRRFYRGVALPNTERSRQFLLSLDVDWTKIPTRSRFLKGVFNALVFIKIPFPAIELNSSGAIRLYGVYY
jgi:uncharacterized protein YfiM (DUF2279 family)